MTAEAARIVTAQRSEAKDHNLVPEAARQTVSKGVQYEKRPVKGTDGKPVAGLFNAWITLDKQNQLNSYTTDMVKATILAFRAASTARDVVAVVFTGAGDKAFCTGGNTKEYAEYYAGNPQEYRGYMRLFNDMVSAILGCDKPVVCRLNGMRVGGGQEIGMACDFSVASDLAIFSQAGPKHGSVPDGGSTDFLPLYIGIERAMASATLCEPWSAHRFYWLGGLTQIVPVLKQKGQWIPNPLVITDRFLDEYGRVVLGEWKTGEEKERSKAIMAQAETDLQLLDLAVDEMCTKLLHTMPDCLTKTLESLRKHKLEHWDRNRESNRAWLALNMMTEANAGFRAFHYGNKQQREVDFVRLRQRLAEGAHWNEELIEEIAPLVTPELASKV